MFRTACVLGALFMAAPAVAAEPPPNPEDAKLAAMFREWLDEEFQRHPVFATQMGNHDHDDRMDDLSPEARRADDLRLRRSTIHTLKTAVRRDDLSPAGKI